MSQPMAVPRRNAPEVRSLDINQALPPTVVSSDQSSIDFKTDRISTRLACGGFNGE